jgi:hypothetical protein
VIYGSVDPNANILFGSVVNESLKDEVFITVIATGFTNVTMPNRYDSRYSLGKNNVANQTATLRQSVGFSAPTQLRVEEDEFEVEEVLVEEERFSPLVSALEINPNEQSYSSQQPTQRVPLSRDEEFDLDVPAFLRNIN